MVRARVTSWSFERPGLTLARDIFSSPPLATTSLRSSSLGLSMVMQSYQHSPENLSGLVRSMLWQIIGPA